MRGRPYDLAVITTFPDVVGGVIHAVGIRNGATREALRARHLPRSRPRCSHGSAMAPCRTSRASRRGAARSGRSASTRRRTVRGRGAPAAADEAGVDPVDQRHLGNLVSIRYAPWSRYSISGRWPAGRRRGTRPVRSGSRTSGRGATEAPDAGEVVFVDEVGLVAARAAGAGGRRRRRRQRRDVTEILVTVEGHHTGAAVDVRAAMGDLEALLRAHTQLLR